MKFFFDIFEKTDYLNLKHFIFLKKYLNFIFLKKTNVFVDFINLYNRSLTNTLNQNFLKNFKKTDFFLKELKNETSKKFFFFFLDNF